MHCCFYAFCRAGYCMYTVPLFKQCVNDTPVVFFFLCVRVYFYMYVTENNTHTHIFCFCATTYFSFYVYTCLVYMYTQFSLTLSSCRASLHALFVMLFASCSSKTHGGRLCRTRLCGLCGLCVWRSFGRLGVETREQLCTSHHAEKWRFTARLLLCAACCYAA